MSIKAREKRTGNSRRSGYTLVELIVVVLILLILAGAGMFGISRAINQVRFARQNESAEIIFSALQNRLTSYSESARLEMLDNEIGGMHIVPVEALKDAQGNTYDLTSLFPESRNKANPTRYQESISYIIGTESDFKAYCRYRNGEINSVPANEATGMSGTELTAMYDLLAEYVADTSLFDATICIEFTPQDGQAFSVLYSQRADNFSYDGSRGVNISDRQTDVRRQEMLGYYGVDTLSKATSTKVEKPSLADVKLVNENTLNLSFRLSRVKSALTQLTYEITLTDAETKTEWMVLSLDGSKLKNDLFGNGDAEAIPCNAVMYDKEGNTTEKSFPIQAWIEGEDQTVHIILDAADLNSPAAAYLEGRIDENSQSSSFHRFGLDEALNGSDIYCTIQANGPQYKATAKRQTNAENPYYAEYTKASDDEVTLTAANFRHFYNFRYEKQETPTVFKLKNDLDWQKFVDEDGLYNGLIPASASEASENADVFPSIPTLAANSTLDGCGKKILNLKLNEAANEAGEMYQARAVEKPVGLIATGHGEIRDLSLVGADISGTNRVGGFCGETDGNLSNLSLDETSVIMGVNNVGGVIGYNEQSSRLNINNVENQTPVTALRSIIRNDEQPGRTTYNDESFYYSYAGGIIGKVTKYVTLDDCSNKNEGDVITQGTYLGGICGENKGRLEKVSVTNLTVSNTSKSDISRIGGIAGINQTGGTIVLEARAVSDCQIETYTENSDAGGAVGQNKGSIVGNISNMDDASGDTNYTIAGVKLSFANSGISTTSAGTAGENYRYWNEGVRVQKDTDGTYMIVPGETISSFRITGLTLNPSAQNVLNDKVSYQAAGNGVNSPASRVYDELDPKVLEWYRENAKESAISGVTVKCDEGQIQAGWTTDSNSYYESQLVYFIKSADGAVIATNVTDPARLSAGITSFSLPVDASWEAATAQVYVRTVSGTYSIQSYYQILNGLSGQDTASALIKEEQASDWKNASCNVKVPLPVPVVHSEMVGVNTYRLYLDNPEDFAGDKRATIQANMQNSPVQKFDSAVGYSNEFTFNVLFSIALSDEATYKDSHVVTFTYTEQNGELVSGDDVQVKSLRILPVPDDTADSPETTEQAANQETGQDDASQE